MELALNMGAFEVLDGNIIQGPWASLSNEELFCVDGGRNVSVAGIICSGLAIIGGVCTIVAGCAALAAPEPTGLLKSPVLRQLRPVRLRLLAELQASFGLAVIK